MSLVKIPSRKDNLVAATNTKKPKPTNIFLRAGASACRAKTSGEGLTSFVVGKEFYYTGGHTPAFQSASGALNT